MITTSVTIASSVGYRDYVLAEIRCAVLRAKLLQNDLVAIGIALRGGFIDANGAIEQLWNCDALRLIATSSTLTGASS